MKTDTSLYMDQVNRNCINTRKVSLVTVFLVYIFLKFMPGNS
jgi:hypothetical protein